MLTPRLHNTRRNGFSLVEILIVVVILGILSAMVIPQFSSATSESQQRNLQAQLQSLNNTVELYKSQRRGAYPNFATDGWGSVSDLTDPNTRSLVGLKYLKEAPRHPRFPVGDANATAISVVTGTARGHATTGWVWNSTARAVYASFFNETTAVMTNTATD
ncbi:MAG TPA: type II secretion system protein [Phycisphaerales bacterium]|nr:type II secretion system protein [Phycisphaerales bacterium]